MVNPLGDYTADQYEEAIAAALRQGDVEAVGSLLHAMAVWHPSRAQTVFETLQLGLLMRSPVE